MNQADYKAIAKLMKLHSQPLYRGVMKSLREMLADYFEKEAEEQCFKKSKKLYGVEQTAKIEVNKIFNRQQFLKECEVEK